MQYSKQGSQILITDTSYIILHHRPSLRRFPQYVFFMLESKEWIKRPWFACHGPERPNSEEILGCEAILQVFYLSVQLWSVLILFFGAKTHRQKPLQTETTEMLFVNIQYVKYSLRCFLSDVQAPESVLVYLWHSQPVRTAAVESL